jgi:hypothetical protein
MANMGASCFRTLSDQTCRQSKPGHRRFITSNDRDDDFISSRQVRRQMPVGDQEFQPRGESPGASLAQELIGKRSNPVRLCKLAAESGLPGAENLGYSYLYAPKQVKTYKAEGIILGSCLGVRGKRKRGREEEGRRSRIGAAARRTDAPELDNAGLSRCVG